MARKKVTPAAQKTPSERVSREVIEEIKEALLAKKSALSKNINSELDEMRTASEGHHLADMDDLGGDANDEETSYKILEIESAELDQIDYALERIEKGTYGLCDDEECGKPIDPERLRALPFATLCLSCKRSQEQQDA
jgi:DnaK suppressor protein